MFSDRGYANPALALADLIGCDTAVARRRVRAAGQVVARVGLDGQVLPARLPETAAVFAAGRVGLRHLEVIADALASPAAQRLTPQVWGGAEQQLAEHAPKYRPRELEAFAASLIAALDQDGPAPDEHEPPQLNELHLAATPTLGGGRIKGVLDAPTFDAVATALDALTAPTPDDQRTLAQRHADALGELCAHALDRAMTPSVGGQRPHLNVHIAPARPRGPRPQRHARLRRGAHRHRPAGAGLRRPDHPDRARRRRATPGPRPGPAHRAQPPTPRGRRPRPRLRVPRLRPPTLLV